MMTELALTAAATGCTATTLTTAHYYRRLHTDPLTGLGNRAALIRGFRRIQRRQNTRTEIGLVLIDLDQFKTINDTHGHTVGDQVIRALANQLKAETRTGELVVRLHGDEFAVLLPKPTTRAEAYDRSQHFSGALNRLVTVDTVTVRTSASAGVGSDVLPHAKLSDLLRQADQQMYSRKARARTATVTALPAQTHREKLTGRCA